MVITVGALIDSYLLIPSVLALIAVMGALQFWEFRAGRVVTQTAKRMRGVGNGLSAASALLLSDLTGLPPVAVFVLAAVPSALAAWLTIVRGRR